MDDAVLAIIIVILFMVAIEIIPTRKWGSNPKKWWGK